MPLRTKPRCVRSPLRSAWTVSDFQYAGTAIEISEELASTPAATTIASSASTTSRSASCEDPSPDTSAYGVTDALHEAAHEHAGLVRVLDGQTDFRRAVRI